MARTLSAFSNAPAQDLHLDERGDLAVVEGLEDIRQRVLEALRFGAGEWYLNRHAGVSYLTDVFVRPALVGVVSTILTDAIRAVEGVESVSGVQIELDTQARKMSYSATVHTAAGDVTVGVNE
ncbi:MAG: hypothetical protein OXO51_15955 [Gemmatimonadota bacterium]|nr:hypothetical protein [Gemmatimonadota bacterium]